MVIETLNDRIEKGGLDRLPEQGLKTWARAVDKDSEKLLATLNFLIKHSGQIKL